jgi:Family of unknown function (DUF6544)
VRWFVAGFLSVHGLIHVLGFAKAFGHAELPQLTRPISRQLGLLWLMAALAVGASVVTLLASPRYVWAVGAIALVLSQTAIASSWRDARAGTAANLLLLLVVAWGWFMEGPRSFRARFEEDAAAGVARPVDAPSVTEADLQPLPGPVRRYLRATGVVGEPRVWNYRLRFRGRIRSGPDAAWMPFEARQQSFTDPPTRLFLMQARRAGLPVLAFHRLIGGRATMQVKIAGAIPIVDARGDVMDQSETVTLFNDMCLLAPATLLGPGITWQAVDERSTRARFTQGGHSISATLLFGEDALAAHGEARFLLPEGEFTYGEFDLQDVRYNVRSATGS